MAFPSDLEIARGATPTPLTDVGAAMGLGLHLLEPYGEHVVKIKTAAIDELAQAPMAKYVVVTAATPTPLGEGKTTTTVGLGQGFAHLALKGAPTGWVLSVREARASVGAGFIYSICGDMRTMPGLSASPAATHIDIDARGEIVGLS